MIGVVIIELEDLARRTIPVILLTLLIVFTLPALGQEEEEEADPLSFETSLYLTAGMDLVPSKAGILPGIVDTTDFRLLTGGGTELVGTWDSSGIIAPLSIGSSVRLNLRVQGTGTAVSFSASVLLNDEEIASGSSNERNLISTTASFDINMDLDRYEMIEGDTLSVSIRFSAGMSRGIQLVFEPNEPSALTFSSGMVPYDVTAHAHGDHMDVMTSITLPWGIESFGNAFATISGEEEVVEREVDSVEISDGRYDLLWEFGILPSGDLHLLVEIMDTSGNLYPHEQEIHPDEHAHDHGGIMVSTGSVTLLILVIGGVMGVGYLGGITPLSSFFDERKMRYLLAFAAGVFIATALFHALPESIHMSGWWALLFVGLGFATLYAIEHWVIDLIDKKFRKSGHSHQFQHTGVKLHLHDHHSKDHEILTNGDFDPSDQVCSHHMENTSEAAFLGVGLHNLIEGIVITTLFMNPETQAVGLIVIIATVLHKAPCTFSIASLLKMAGNTPKQINRKVLIVLAMTPIGAILALLIFMRLDAIFVGFALAFSAGTFLEIGLLDLTPESLKPKHGRWIALVAIALGFGLLWLFSLVHVH